MISGWKEIEQLFAEKKYADEHQGSHLDKFSDVYIPEASRYDQYTGQEVRIVRTGLAVSIPYIRMTQKASPELSRQIR